jgi:hypothetical protein
MKKTSNSTIIIFALVILGSIMVSLDIYLYQFDTANTSELTLPIWIPVLTGFIIFCVLLGGAGFFGIKLSSKIGFPEIWDEKISIKNKIFLPAVFGIIIGIIYIIINIIFTKLFLGISLQSSKFPISILISFYISIYSEILRLFLISFFIWLFSIKLQYNQNIVFWIAGIFCAFIFTFVNIYIVMNSLDIGSININTIFLLVEIVIHYGLFSLVAAYVLRKYGIINAIGIHFWSNIIWYVVYGIIK